MNTLLEIRNLVKTYGTVKAVNGISFSVEQGTCYGLLGPNGAGKTTVIEVIEGVLPPTSGEIFYNGSARGASFREEVGIQFQETSLLNYMTVKETLKTFQSLYTDTEDLEELAKTCRLEDFWKQMNDRISGGQKQRFLMALALVNKPKLLFLDEPSTGLDPQARQNLWEIIEKIKSQGKTLILTTHYMEEAHHLCDEIAIMDYGKIIAQGSPDALIAEYAGGVTVVLDHKNFSKAPEELSLDISRNKQQVEIRTHDINACLKTLIKAGVDLTDMRVRSPNLESVFLNLTGRQLRD